MRKEKKMGMKPSAGRLTTLLWLSYRYRAHKKLKILSDNKLSEVCQTRWGIRNLDILNNEWRKLSEEWWKKKKKKKTQQPNSPKYLSNMSSDSIIYPLLRPIHWLSSYSFFFYFFFFFCLVCEFMGC